MKGMKETEKYKIIRFYKDRGSVTIARGVSLEEAQAHCRNKETSSETCAIKQNLTCLTPA
jgi:hypothetical protein